MKNVVVVDGCCVLLAFAGQISKRQINLSVSCATPDMHDPCHKKGWRQIGSFCAEK